MSTSNDLIIIYPAFAGGKFISNCLCLSKKFVPASDRFDLEKIDDYDYRLEFVSKTLPPKTEMKKWLSYEFNEHDRNGAFYKQAKKLNLRCTVTDHHFTQSIIDDWFPCDILKLINYEKFRSLAHHLKSKIENYNNWDSENRYNEIKGKSWPTYKEFSAVGLDTRKIPIDKSVKEEIDIFYPLGTTNIQTYLYNQNTIFDKTEFLNEMKKTYHALELEDFNEEITSIFYTRYATLHNI